MESLSGTVKKVIYKNEENSYAVLELETAGGAVTVVGSLCDVCAGESLEVEGEYKSHRVYGTQLVAHRSKASLPGTREGILDYLMSGAVKGLGEVTAGRLVEKFGDRALEILEKEPEKLRLIEGMSKERAQRLSGRFKEIIGARGMIGSIVELGLSPHIAARVYGMYGASSLKALRNNPYLLCSEPFGVPFDEADKLAAAMGIEEGASCRTEAGVEYVLRYNLGNGHTFLPYAALSEVAAKVLCEEESSAILAIERMSKSGALVVRDIANLVGVYIKEYARGEDYIARRLISLAQNSFSCDSEARIEKMEKELGISYEPLQRRAIAKAAESGVFILTGGPGTGKTTALKGMVRLFEELGKKCELAAPTGRAAKRMAEVTGKETRTIHRLLETAYDSSRNIFFKRCEKNPIEADVVIIDEASMVDVTVFEALLRAIPAGCSLVLVGDADQLPPVGPGNVLKDMLKSELFSSVELKEIFRQARDSLIVVNAHAINAGEYPECNSIESDFFFVKRQDKPAVAAAVVQLVSKSLPQKFGYDPIADIQVLSPIKKGETGTKELNDLLRGVLNPASREKKEYRSFDTLYREGDKVMQIKNNYDAEWLRPETGELGTGLYNGDIGIIKEIDNYNSQITIDFEGRISQVAFENLAEIEPAYAVTVHKSQGNEFPCVVMPVVFAGGRLLNRNLLYTAVTRAKSMMVLVGMPEAVYRMVENNSETKRFTGLKYMLLKAAEDYENS